MGTELTFKTVKREAVLSLLKEQKLPKEVLVIDLENGSFSLSFGLRSAFMYSVGATKYSGNDVLKSIVLKWNKVAEKINLSDKIKNRKEIWIITPNGGQTAFSELFIKFLERYLQKNKPPQN